MNDINVVTPLPTNYLRSSS